MKKLLMIAVIALSMAACEPEGDLYVISSVSVSPISGDVGTEFEWQAEVSTLVASELTVTLNGAESVEIAQESVEGKSTEQLFSGVISSGSLSQPGIYSVSFTLSSPGRTSLERTAYFEVK